MYVTNSGRQARPRDPNESPIQSRPRQLCRLSAPVCARYVAGVWRGVGAGVDYVVISLAAMGRVVRSLSPSTSALCSTFLTNMRALRQIPKTTCKVSIKSLIIYQIYSKINNRYISYRIIYQITA